ncbi:Testis-expressed sequence 15 protein [Platysternon megacephalum]|uniref:Testis-expressed sequence 15 protein n=1 Tax=Platysternon megacephalum TaxID=55544 RepID=A0A4D9E1S5_9SAUR|nr:Testis-expressed sequence 15 protein [Platysternon megacephalum]
MREEGRQGRELEEHFCFLVLPWDEVSKIYQSGIHTSESAMKELGNPLLGVYLFRHVDVALNYANRLISAENILVFKVLFGKVKKIQPPMGKKKVALDPTPNFDCHMSRIAPTLKDPVDLQAIGSSVYFYEYNIHSKPVDKPRQCLPYAVVTVRFVGQKVETHPLITSVRFLSKGFPKYSGRRGSWKNCTVAKRIGKGAQATIIYEHFKQPVNLLAFRPEESSSCSEVNSENTSGPKVSSSCENTQNKNGSVAEAHDTQVEHNIQGRLDSSPVQENESSLPLVAAVDTNGSISNDHMVNLKCIISDDNFTTVSAAYSSSGSSTVITSRLIMDPRLKKREGNPGKQNTEAVFHGNSTPENGLDYLNSEMKISATLNTPSPEEPPLLNDPKHGQLRQRHVEQASRKEVAFIKEFKSILNADKEHAVENKQVAGSITKLPKEIVEPFALQDVHTHPASKSVIEEKHITANENHICDRKDLKTHQITMGEQLRKCSSFPFGDTKPEIDLQESLSMKDKADHCYIEKSSNLHKNNIKHLPVHDSKNNLSFTKKSRHNDPPPDQKCQSVSMGKSVSSVLPANFARNTHSEAMPPSIADSSSCLYSRSQKGSNPHMPSVIGNILSSFSADCQNKNSKKAPAEDLNKREKQRSHTSLSHAWRWGKMSVAQNKNNADKKSEISHQVCNGLYSLKKHDKGQGSAQLNHSKRDKYASVKGGQKFQESQSINLTVLEDNQRHTPEQSLYDDKGMNIGIQHPESIKSHEGKTKYNGEMHNQFQENNYTSEIGNKSTDSSLTCAENTMTSNRDYEVNSEGFDTQDDTLHIGVHGRMHLFKHDMRKQYSKVEEDKCVCHHVACESIASDQIIGEENFHQSKLQDTLLSEKANVEEGPIKAHKLIYSATEISANKNCIGKREDASKEVKGNSSIKETINDQIYLSHAICRTDKVLRDCFNKECLCFRRENEPVSLDKHFCRDSKESDASGAAFLDEEQSWICNQEMETDINVHDFNQMHTCQLEKEFSNVPGIWMEVCDTPHLLDLKRSASGLNLIFEEGCALTEAYLMETENIATFIKEKGIIPDNKRESEELSATAEFCRPAALPEAPKWEEQNAVLLITTISVPSGNVEHEERVCFQPEETYVSERNSSCHENSVQEIFKQMIEEKCEDIFLQGLEFESEIEIPLEQHEESLSVPQNPHSHEGGSDEEVDSLYQYLTDRIDWESLFGNTSQKILEKSEDHCSSGKQSCTKEDKTESLSTTVWPDLQITITNILKSGVSPPNIGIEREMWRCAIESPGLEVNMELSEEQRSEEYMQNLDLTNKMETCLPICVHEAESHMPEKESKTFTAPVTVSDVLNKGSSFYSTKPKDNSNESKSKKGVQSKVKRKHPHNKSLTNKIRPQKASTHSPIYRNSKLCGKKREHYSSEMFSLLFEGRMKTLAQSEKHIKNVLNTLCSEASLCKSKRLSKKIDGAMFHLRKAQRRVLKSLKIVTKVGEKRQKGPLPKCYEIICNDLWESCDLEGHSFLTTGKYSSAHFSQKRKCNIKGNKQTVAFKKASDTVTCMPIKRRFKNKGDKMREMVSEEDMGARSTTGCAPVVLKDIISQIHHCKSDLTVASSVTCSQFSAATCKAYLAFESDNVRDTRRITELQTVSENSVGLDAIGLEDLELTNKEHKVFVNVSSKIHIQGTAGPCGSVTRQDHIPEANTFTNKNISKPLSLPVERDDSVGFCTDKRKDGACKTNVKMNAVIHTSLLKTAAESCLNANTNKQDVSTLSATHKNLDSILSTEKETMFSAGSGGISTNQSVGIGNFSSGSMRQMPAAGGKQVPLDHEIISAKAASLKMSSNISSERVLETHSFETPTVPLSGQLQDRGYNRKETSNSEMCCLSNYSKVAEKETHVTETINLEPLAKILYERENNIEIENYLKNVSSVSLVYNALTPFSNQYISQEVGQNTFPKIKETGLVESKVKSPVNLYLVKDVPGRSSAKVVLEQKTITHRKDHSSCNKEYRCIQSSSNNSSAFTAPVLRKPIDKKFVKRNEDWKECTNKDRQINSELKSGIMAKQGIRSITGTYDASPRKTHQNLTAHVTKLNADNLSDDHPNKRKGINSKNKHRAVGTELKSLAFITEISNILQKADETSSLKILQEQITVCDNLLPSFVKAFEEKQGCSFKHILVSRELLVERKLWNNCKSKLKSHAVDSLVELQMIMETIQFIENKKCFLEREPTFRSLLWYDGSLYRELLGRPSGYQQQSNFFPAFQRRLKYNVFRELQSYRKQLLELFEKTRWENKSYYAFLKFRREIDECEAVIQPNSDCLDFFLSVPFTWGVNFGDTLEDLETVRKSAVELINTYRNLPDAHAYAEKEDHLWVIMEIISTKISFIKACESMNMKASLFGLEHIFFDAAKSLVWKDRRLLLNKASPNKKKQLLCKINQDALSKLYEVYEYVAEEFRTEKSNNITEKKNDIEKSKYCENKGKHGDENSDFLSVLLSHPDISCVGEILDEAQFADLKKLQQLMLRCTEHLESLKTYFQILQEEDVSKILITEQNVLDTMKNDGINAVILKPEAVETYIEVLMMYETVHFLKNSIARKTDEQRFRSLLWFDLSLLPELAHCQKKMSSFSFLKDNSMDNLCKTVESAISDLKSELDIICNYAETINCSYALHLLTRELSELSETRKLIQNLKPSIFTYVECVPYTISVNYGSTVTELDYNYNQFSLLLENLMLAARKDLGKMAHIMKIMKTIEHMKFACAKKGKSVLSLLIYQMLNNWRKTCQLKRKGDMKMHLTKTKKSVCETQAPGYVIKASSQSQKKRPSFVSSHGDTPEYTESSPPSRCKKQKVGVLMAAASKNGDENETCCHIRENAARVNPQNEKDLAWSISPDNLGNKRPLEKAVQDQLPRSPLHSKDLEAVYCSPHVKCTADASKSSFVNLKGLTSQQSSANLKHMIRRNSNFYKSARKHHEGFAPCDRKCENAHLSLEKEPLLQKSLENNLCSTHKSVRSTTKQGGSSSAVSAALNRQHVQESDATGNISRSSLLAEYSKTNNFATKPDRKDKEHEKNSESPSNVPVSTSDLPVIMANKNTQSPSVCSPLEPHSDEKAKSPAGHSAVFQNELPPSTPPVQRSLVQAYETAYPYYSFYSCHQSDSNGSSITQTYQGITYQVQQFAHSGTSAVASNVYNAHSNMFYSQSFSYAALGELQRPNYAQIYPVPGYFSSQMPLPYSSQVPSLPQYAANQPWSQGLFPYPSNIGSSSGAVWTSTPWQQAPFHPGY